MAKNDFQYGGWNSYTLQYATIITFILPHCRVQSLHPARWHVALESWQWIHQVAAPCNVIRGSGMTNHDMPLNSPKRPPYWNSTSGFDFDYITAVDMSFFLHQCPKFYPNRTTHGRKNDVMSIFKMAVSSHLGFWGSNHGFFEKSNKTY